MNFKHNTFQLFVKSMYNNASELGLGKRIVARKTQFQQLDICLTDCVFELRCSSFILTAFFHVACFHVLSDAGVGTFSRTMDDNNISPAYISSSFMLSWYVWEDCQQKQPPCESSRIQAQHPSSSCHHPTRSACIASATVVTWSCMKHILISARPSSSFSPSYGTQALFDHHNQTAFGRIVAFPERTERPAHHVRF